MKILLTVAYDGTNYCGWQRQSNGLSVQQVIEERGLPPVLGEPAPVLGASRTDAGVHALGQRACFSAENLAVPLEKLPMVINNGLPEDIAVVKAEAAPDGFHPIFDAKRKTYEYAVLNAAWPNPKQRLYSEHVRRELDFAAMAEAAGHFIGEHDFSAFRATDGSARTTVRTIYEARLFRDGGLITFRVTGNGFLYNMVRIMAGTLIEVGLGRICAGEVPGIILSRDRTKAGRTAPARGLTLIRVEY